MPEAVGSICDYLPGWVQVDRLIMEDVGLDALGPGQSTLPNAFLCPGLDHISNNMQSDLDAHLQGFATWLAGFKTLMNLLCRKHLLKRLVARCISGGPFAVLARCFETVVASVAKWRWGTIVKALPQVIDLHRPLSIVWDSRKFAGNPGQDGDGDRRGAEEGELNTDELTKTLKDPTWLPYARMLLKLRRVANFISAWGSGCACHAPGQMATNFFKAFVAVGVFKFQAFKLLRFQASLPVCTSLCPCVHTGSWFGVSGTDGP